MNENDFWTTLWIVICGTICLIAGAIAWTCAKNAPVTRDAMAICVKAGNAWVNDNCIPPSSVTPQSISH